MNIQIFGSSKCFDTKKAQRWFKERRVKFQYVDMERYGMSAGEYKSAANAVGESNLLDGEGYVKTPVVRNGRRATVGYQPDIWEAWRNDASKT
ncbi:ArsC family transcriptional regulator [Clostridia bacterium]|nr:ArsC family transcriptional regulator [Clostridia bacterium]